MQQERNVVASVDWLSLTIWIDHDLLLSHLGDIGLRDGLSDTGHGGLGFKRLEFGKYGFQLYSDPVHVPIRKPNQVRSADTFCSLRFTGETVRAVGLPALVGLYECLVECGYTMRCTRLDFAFDTQLFSVSELVAARSEKDADGYDIMHCRGEAFREIVEDTRGKVTGHTAYFGSRQSEAMLRVYLKTDGDSFGAGEHFTRVEIELKGDRAAFHLVELMAAPLADWGTVAGAWVNAFIQVKKSWWETFTAGFKSFWLRLRRAPTTLEKMGNWIKRQVAPTLAAYSLATTGGELDDLWELYRDLLHDGAKRMDALKRAIVADNAEPITELTWHFADGGIEF